MPILYTRTYPHELFGLNPEMRCVFVESHEKRGGDPSTVQVRPLEMSLPLTLRDNYSPEGSLGSESEARDIKLIEEECQVIIKHLRQGVLVCLPTLLLSEEMALLKKRTPKVEQYLLKRLDGMKAGFPLLGL
tara:strand:+ start:588 stop:983 length:396 start_codon:yes stop_codon:yes gene_type:complete